MTKNPLKIKVCGMKDPDNLEKLCAIGPDYVGYIFYPESKRFVGLQPDSALFSIPPVGILKVGVFVNEQIYQVKQIVEKYRLELVQLHGEESPEYCRALMEVGIPVIKALHPSKEDSGPEAYNGLVRMFLFDTPGPGWGGSGRKFDWSLLKHRRIQLPFLLSGGIGPGDSRVIREMENEKLWGIDLNSRFEIAPGLKDIRLLEDFFTEVRK